MAERVPVIELVDYNSGLSWRVTSDECRYWIKRLGETEFRKQMREQLERALDIAVSLTACIDADEGKS